MNEANGWQLRKHKPVHQHCSPILCIFLFCTDTSKRVLKAGKQRLPYVLALACTVSMVVSILIGIDLPPKKGMIHMHITI